MSRVASSTGATSRSTAWDGSEASGVKSLSAIVSENEGRGGDRQTTRSKLRYGCFLPDLTGLARPPPIADLQGLYRVTDPAAQAWRRSLLSADQKLRVLKSVPQRGQTLGVQSGAIEREPNSRPSRVREEP